MDKLVPEELGKAVSMIEFKGRIIVAFENGICEVKEDKVPIRVVPIRFKDKEE